MPPRPRRVHPKRSVPKKAVVVPDIGFSGLYQNNEGSKQNCLNYLGVKSIPPHPVGPDAVHLPPAWDPAREGIHLLHVPTLQRKFNVNL